MIDLAQSYEATLSEFDLVGTGTTSKRIMAETDLTVERKESGPMGGDTQIGAEVAEGRMDGIVFLRDPLTAQPHEPDISALLRICDVHDVPLATTRARRIRPHVGDRADDPIELAPIHGTHRTSCRSAYSMGSRSPIQLGRFSRDARRHGQGRFVVPVAIQCPRRGRRVRRRARRCGLGPLDEGRDEGDVSVGLRSGVDDALKGVEEVGPTVRISREILTVCADEDGSAVVGLGVGDRHREEVRVPERDVRGRNLLASVSASATSIESSVRTTRRSA